MGYIKKLKNNELVGGTDKHTIYPVTSTKAVFEEVSENSFKSQKYLNNNITGDRINKETITDDNIAVGTITKGKLSPQVQTMLDEGQKKALTPKGNYNSETEYEALDLVFDPVTNSSYISLQTPNAGHPVDENAEGYEEGWWEKTLDGTAVNTAQATINAKVDELDAQVDQAIEDARQELQDATDAANDAAGEARDAASTVESLTALQVADAQVGYFECTDTAASGAAANETKLTTTDTIGESHYIKTVGSHVKIKMAAANTHAAPVYLQFGNQTNTKAPLLYNGEAVSASNSWDKDEVISVYFDGTNYQASNAQGGGGKAEKIKYNNSISGLVAENVQEALDEVANDIQEETSYNLNNFITRNGSLTPANWNWDSRNQRGKHKAIPVTEGELLHITMQTVGTGAGNYCGWLTSDYIEGNQGSGTPIPYVSGTSRFMVDDLSVRVPENAAWLCLTVLDGNGDTVNSSVSKVTKIKDKISIHHEELGNCHDGSKIKSSQSKTVVWTSADFANTAPGYGTNAKRVLLKPASMLDVSDVYKIVLNVPYSAVEEAQVDWCMICFYNNGKAVLLDLSTPSFNFEGSDVSIEIDLSEDKYVGINYISPYFGSESNIDIASIDWTAISVTAYKYVTENARAIAEYAEVVNISDYPYVNCIMKSGAVTSKGKTTNTGYCVWENNNTTGYGRWGKFVPIEAGATYRIKGGSLDTVYAFTINDEHTEGRVKNFAGEEQTYIALSANEERLIVAPYNAAYLYFTVRDNTEGYPKELSSMFKVSPKVDEDVNRIDKDLYKDYGWHADESLWEMGSYNINTGDKQIYAENATLYIMTKTRIAGTPKFRSVNPKIKLMLLAWDGDTWLGAWNGNEFSSVAVDIETMCFSKLDIASFKDYGYSFALQLRYMDQVYIPLSYSNYVQIFNESVSAVSDLMEFKDTLDDYIPPVVLMNADKESLIASLCNVTTPSASADMIDSDNFFAHDYLCFAHISDTHSWNKNVEHAVDIVNSGMFYNIDFLIHTGDIQRALYHDVKEAINLWIDYVDTMKGSAKPALTCVGNHEHEKMDSISGFYNRYMKYMVDKEWLVEGTNIISGKPYWYKDFDKYKVRLIALDDFEAPYDSYYASKNYSNDVQLSPAQIEWFVGTLNTVPEDYTVIIASHAPCFTNNSSKINSEWSTTNTPELQPLHMSEYPVWDIVDAYQNKGTLSKTYTYTDNNVQTAWGNCIVNADFSAANGIFAFYIHGHNHVDYIHKNNAFPNQTHVAVAGGVLTKRWDDCGRSRYGKSYDSINVYVLNTDTHTVHIVKLGATMRRDGIERGHTSFTYYVPET